MSKKNGWPISWGDVHEVVETVAGNGSGGAGFINYTGGIEIDGNYIKFTDLTAENGLNPGDEIVIGLCRGYSTCDSIVGSYKLDYIINAGVSDVMYPINGYEAYNFNTDKSGFKLEGPKHGGCWQLYFGGAGISAGDGNDDYQVMFVRIYKANA